MGPSTIKGIFRSRTRRGRGSGFLEGSGAGILLGLVSPMLLASAEAKPAFRVRQLASGLANPRGLLVQGQQVLVSEAGSGRQAGSVGGPCFSPRQLVQLCQGYTGAIGAWDKSTHSYSRLMTGLPSLAQNNGSDGTGIADLTWHDSIGLVGVFGLGTNPNQIATLNLDTLFGQVVSINLQTKDLQPRSNLAAYEEENNPDQSEVDSNPYAIQSFSGKLFATDAGGNTMLTIDPSSAGPSGSFPITDHFVFPKVNAIVGPPIASPPMPVMASAVPTGLSVDPRTNSLKIGELTGFPFVPGTASVFTLQDPPNAPPAQDLTGFTMITDVASAADGSLFVLEYSSNYFENPALAPGSIWRVAPNGVRTQIITGLINPTGLAVDRGDVLYVSNNANGINGQLLQFSPAPGPLPLLGVWAAWSRSRLLRRRQATARRSARL